MILHPVCTIWWPGAQVILIGAMHSVGVCFLEIFNRITVYRNKLMDIPSSAWFLLPMHTVDAQNNSFISNTGKGIYKQDIECLG